MQMTKAEFFIKAMQAGRLKDKDWILKAFSVVFPNEKDKNTPFNIIPFSTGVKTGRVGSDIDYRFIGPDGEDVYLTDYMRDKSAIEPVYRLKDRLTIKKGDIENLKKPSIETNYGNLLTNWLLLVYPFGDIIEYMEGRFSLAGSIEPILVKKLTSEPKDGKYEPGVIYVSMYNKYRKAASLIAGLSQLCVPSATEKSMSTHPDMEKLKAELLEKYKGRLDDPAVIAEMEAAMIKLDAEWLKGDPAEGFLIDSKSRTVVRKKTFMWTGLETAFTDGTGGKLLATNLSDGISLKDLPEHANNLREGSFDRGAETALGGDEVKKMLDITQNATIAEDDCGTKIGFPMNLSEDVAKISIGQYIFEKGGKETLLTDDNIKSYIGKDIVLRTAYFCKTARSSVCKKCIGTTYAEHPTGIATAISNVGSTFMYIFMGSMHAKALETATFDYRKHIK